MAYLYNNKINLNFKNKVILIMYVYNNDVNNVRQFFL